MKEIVLVDRRIKKKSKMKDEEDVEENRSVEELKAICL